MNSKLSVVLFLFVVALVLGGSLGWFLSRQSSELQIPLPQTNSLPSQRVESPHVEEIVELPPVQQEKVFTNSASSPAVRITWDHKLDTVLLSDADPATKAASILALIPGAPEDGKVELARHLVNMVQDDNYTGTAELLVNTNTSSAVSSVLMNDLLNRNNQLKLPMLLAVARAENHPLRQEAKDMLGVFLQEDKGENWDEWQLAVDNWLKQNH